MRKGFTIKGHKTSRKFRVEVPRGRGSPVGPGETDFTGQGDVEGNYVVTHIKEIS